MRYGLRHNPSMKKTEAVSYYRTQTQLAKELGIDQSTISGWGEFPPVLRQLQIEALTDGALMAEPECDPYRVVVRRPKRQHK